MSLPVLKHQNALDFVPAPQTLASFVAGRNASALAAVTELAALSGDERLVYLWGAAGSGRTHLLRAAVAAATKSEELAVLADARTITDSRAVADVEQPDLRTLVDNPHRHVRAPADAVHGDLDALVDADRSDMRTLVDPADGDPRAPAGKALGDQALARTALVNYALVAIDDVQDLDAAAQIALFDLCNALRAKTGRLLVAGDRSPRDLEVREDLRTRLASGLAFELHPLTDAERIAALRAHAARRGLALDDAVVDYLLARVARDLASLTALVDRVDRASLEQQRAVTIPLVRAVLQQHDEREGLA